tara:strand:- start:377 stop:817 length:441 start_codon:yes stop_codon:yes gene_type:complete
MHGTDLVLGDRLLVGGNSDLKGNLDVAGEATLTSATITALSNETVEGGADAGNATALSVNTMVSFVSTDTSKTHVSLADGVIGQVKIIVHKARAGSANLVITPANFGAGSTLTSNLAARSVSLIFDGTNWQVFSGEITGTAEFVIA